MITDINIINNIAQKAGSEILKIYNSDSFEVEVKADKSPLTKADKISHVIIESELKKNFPEIPILSEEGKNIAFDLRKNWEYFWLVDPLDGTKEFIKKNGEFTVNIALIKNNLPIAGVIFAPTIDTLYYGTMESGAYKKTGINSVLSIQVNNIPGEGIISVQSRSHSSEEEEKYLSKFKIKNKISIGSSLKFCMVAEGKAQIYYRSGPTWEWDTAAGHAIVNASGGSVVGVSGPFIYNKVSLLNGGFIASCKL